MQQESVKSQPETQLESVSWLRHGLPLGHKACAISKLALDTTYDYTILYMTCIKLM